jgi:hypothetical protein
MLTPLPKLLDRFSQVVELISDMVYPLVTGDMPEANFLVAAKLQERWKGKTWSHERVSNHVTAVSDVLMSMELTPNSIGRNVLSASAERAALSESARRDALQEWTKSCDLELDQRYIELLTAASLCLYFLGLHSWGPWERVLTWADDVGGLPDGVCLAKAIGDIVRTARLGSPLDAPNPALLVLSYRPDLVIDCIAKSKPLSYPGLQDGLTLGRCYELLQFRLYGKTDKSVSYYVPRARLESHLAQRKDLPSEQTPEERWASILKWLHTQVFATPRGNQHVYVIDDPHIPACFINNQMGLYAFEARAEGNGTPVQPTFPFPANYMRNVRLRLYHKNFSNKPEAHRDLLNRDHVANARLFEELCGRNA